jgi:hypothetical protein
MVKDATFFLPCLFALAAHPQCIAVHAEFDLFGRHAWQVKTNLEDIVRFRNIVRREEPAHVIGVLQTVDEPGE